MFVEWEDTRLIYGPDWAECCPDDFDDESHRSWWECDVSDLRGFHPMNPEAVELAKHEGFIRMNRIGRAPRERTAHYRWCQNNKIPYMEVETNRHWGRVAIDMGPVSCGFIFSAHARQAILDRARSMSPYRNWFIVVTGDKRFRLERILTNKHSRKLDGIPRGDVKEFADFLLDVARDEAKAYKDTAKESFAQRCLRLASADEPEYVRGWNWGMECALHP